MCQFVSWIEKDKKVFFLTGEQVFHSERGNALREWCISADDYRGHGAIRWFYDFEGGDDKECADFSTPKNFPAPIVRAIKSGAMQGLGTATSLLSATASVAHAAAHVAARAEYNRVEQAARAEYDRVENPAYAEYTRVEQAAGAEYDRVVQTTRVVQAARAEYDRVEKPAYAEYTRVTQATQAECNRMEQAARAECNRMEQAAFWDLFAVPGNRAEAWK